MAWKKSSVLLLAAAWAMAAEWQRFEAVEPHMGTLVRITLYAPSTESARAAFGAAFARIGELDEKLSDYKPRSEVSLLRDGPVSADLWRVLRMGQQMARESGGAFDVTLGPLTQLWRRGVPADGERLAALARCGFRNLEVRGRTVRLLRGGMRVDLGGIAKGYAADEALAVLERRGLRRALVAVSGDMAIGAAPPGRDGWQVAVGATALSLRHTAVSTSGDSEQHRVGGGKRYSHILDPRTGMGLETAEVVTVIARRGLVADPLATAISVLGRERGAALAKRHRARVIYHP